MAVIRQLLGSVLSTYQVDPVVEELGSYGLGFRTGLHQRIGELLEDICSRCLGLLTLLSGSDI